MSDDPHYCREQALKCANRAIRAEERRDRKVLTKAAQVWLKLALEIEARLEASKASEFGFEKRSSGTTRCGV